MTHGLTYILTTERTKRTEELCQYKMYNHRLRRDVILLVLGLITVSDS